MTARALYRAAERAARLRAWGFAFRLAEGEHARRGREREAELARRLERRAFAKAERARLAITGRA